MNSTNFSWGNFIILITTGLYVVAGLELKVDTNPKSKQVRIGQRVVLHCVFNQNACCIWVKDGRQIKIGNRYSMINKAYNENMETMNCSLEIKLFSKSDYGSWKCSTRVGSDEEKATSSAVAILSTPELQCQKIKDKPKKVKTGKSVTLQCKFNNEVKCVWQKNGEVIKIINRYKFKSKAPSSTKDCSITIKGVQKHDEGEWKCSSMADDSHDSVKCEPVVVKLNSKN